jgi:hypothetical protein
MYRAQIFAAAAMMAVAAIDPPAMATSTQGQPAVLYLVRGGGPGGGFGGRGGGFRGGYAARGAWGYRPWGYGYRARVYPYGFGCPYLYSYPYCIFPD